MRSRSLTAGPVTPAVASDVTQEINEAINAFEALRVQTLFIEPGSPWENGYVESFNGKLRDELLDREIFYTLTPRKQES